MLIGLFTGNKDIKMFFKLSYWSTQWFSASALLSPSTIRNKICKSSRSIQTYVIKCCKIMSSNMSRSIICKSALLEIIAKYDVLINEWGGLYYRLLEVSVNKTILWKNVSRDDWIAERAIIASDGCNTKVTFEECHHNKTRCHTSIFLYNILMILCRLYSIRNLPTWWMIKMFGIFCLNFLWFRKTRTTVKLATIPTEPIIL